jgi:beta-N-acetylhexosaminidase
MSMVPPARSMRVGADAVMRTRNYNSRIRMPLSSRRELGQFLIGSFPGTTVPVELRALAREFDLGGVILFSRNIEAPEQLAELTAECEALGRTMPAWVSVDQEGGRVARLKEPFTRWPPMATLGRSGSEALAERFARALAAEVRAAGFTLDYAPVLDIHTNPKNQVIGDRALAERADDVARLGRIIVRTLQAEGVAACGKHFPGHGDTSQDSHHELPLVEQPPDRLRAVEFVPFRAAIEAGVAFIMTAHVLVPSLDEERPSTLSPRVVQAILRDELGFGGVILSDDLEMKAISARYAVPLATLDAIRAGCDAVLICSGNIELQVEALEALVKARESSAIPMARLDDAFQRLRTAKERFLVRERDTTGARVKALRAVIGRDEHQAIAAEMAAFL